MVLRPVSYKMKSASGAGLNSMAVAKFSVTILKMWGAELVGGAL